MQHDPTSLICLMEERKWGQVSPMKMGSWCHVFLDSLANLFQQRHLFPNEHVYIFMNNFVWNQIISSTFPHLHFNPPMPHSSWTLNLVCLVLYARIASLFTLGPSLLHKPSFYMINISSLMYLKSPNKHSMYSPSCTHKKLMLISL